MSLKDLDKTPFPWFGGKAKAADLVWQLLGDVPHYCEPFFGGGAVLLNRPHPCNRPYYSETINDLDGFVVNFWRAVQWAPEETARAASWPVTEADKTARQLALLRWRDNALDRLAGDAAYYDAVMAGWWAWALCVQIGAFEMQSAWTADPVTGKIYKQPPGKTREPGVSRDLPHVSSDGQGVNRPGTREPGVLDPITAKHGLSALDSIDWGQAYHDLAMPELIRWFRHLSARLRHVRVINGDWSRLVTTGAAFSLPVRKAGGVAGVFLDPPYAKTAGRCDDLYSCDSGTVAHDVADWCIENGDNPKFRIVLAGFEGEHGDRFEKAGWIEYEWFANGHLTGGYGNVGQKSQQHRERLWASPHCLKPEPKAKPKANGKAKPEPLVTMDLFA